MEYKTKHYIFHCDNNKTAERDIEAIAKRQEQAYADITQTLNVKYESLINYYLVNTLENVNEINSQSAIYKELHLITNKFIDEIKNTAIHDAEKESIKNVYNANAS